MLFTPHQHHRYQLWNARRCAFVLGISMFLFFSAVFLCAMSIQVRPSAEINTTASHDLSSVTQMRIIKQDGSIDLLSFRCDKLPRHYPDLTLTPEQNDSKSSFVLFQARSLWQFMWERW